MCIVTLSVLKKCHHELATIELCSRGGCDVPDDLKESAVESGEEPFPRLACTPSLGWSIFETLNVSTPYKNDRKVANVHPGISNLRLVQSVARKERQTHVWRNGGRDAEDVS